MITLMIAKLHLTYLAVVNAPCDLPSGGAFNFLSIPHWWKYLPGKRDGFDNCVPAFNGFSSGGLHDVLAVGLAVLEILLRLAGIIAVIYIIIAGIQYILSSGNPDKTAAAQTRIINTAIGLAIVLVAVAAVTFIGNSFK